MGNRTVEGRSIPIPNRKMKNDLIYQPSIDIRTMFDNVTRAAKLYGKAEAIGTRTQLRTHIESRKIKRLECAEETEVEKNWTYFEMSDYHYISFIEYEKLVYDCGSGLRSMGLLKNDKIHLYGATSAYWLAMAHGASSQSITVVTAYNSLGDNGLRKSMIETGSKAIFLDLKLFPILSRSLRAADSIQYVVYNSTPQLQHHDIHEFQTSFPDIQVISFEELIILGQSHPVEPTPPTPDDLACIMYTSGSTGDPKGVTIKHKAVVAAMAGIHSILSRHIDHSDAFLSYLPQSHIFEFICENMCLFWGVKMGYGTPETLSNASVRNCKGDMQEFKPTILAGVPAVWESIRKTITAKVNSSSFITRTVFGAALALKAFLKSGNVPGAEFVDMIAFNRLKEVTGGRLRICLNGGAPIAKATSYFISMALAPMISGYGLTETCAMGALQDLDAWNQNASGNIPAGVEVKLVDFPDAGYLSSNNPPQGEIWIRGDSVTEGYWNDESESRNSITADGWFKTGDIGELDRNGHLKIIDRKKNLIKMSHGEYIAVEKLESVYRATPFVLNIFVHAAPDQARPIAIVVSQEQALRNLVIDKPLRNEPYQRIIHNKQVNAIALAEIQKVGREAGLTNIEIINGLVLVDGDWTPENGFTTAAQKIQRRKILAKYHEEIACLYGSGVN